MSIYTYGIISALSYLAKYFLFSDSCGAITGLLIRNLDEWLVLHNLLQHNFHLFSYYNEDLLTGIIG